MCIFPHTEWNWEFSRIRSLLNILTLLPHYFFQSSWLMRCCGIYLQGCYRSVIFVIYYLFFFCPVLFYEVRFPAYGFIKFLTWVVAAGVYRKQAHVSYSRTKKREQMVIVSRFLSTSAKLQTASFSLVISVHLSACIILVPTRPFYHWLRAFIGSL